MGDFPEVECFISLALLNISNYYRFASPTPTIMNEIGFSEASINKFTVFSYSYSSINPSVNIKHTE